MTPTLANELVLELVQKLERKLVLRGERFLSYDRLHCRSIAPNGILRILEKHNRRGEGGQ